MAKSSINFQKAKDHSTDHNFRKDKPNYLLPKKFQKENEFWKHKKSEKEIFENELAKAKRKGGRKPQFENSRWEAVLNLNENHTMLDVKRVASHIARCYNITPSSIAIHRDEGYTDKDNGKPIYNYHAHINFITYKNGKQNWRKEHIKPAMLSDLQTKVAELLKMERGQKGSKAVRLDHKAYKSKKQEEAKELAKQKDLKAEVARLRAELKEQGAVREQYAQLEQLNKELKEQIKIKELTVKDLKDKLSIVRDLANKKLKGEYQVNRNLQNELSQAQKTILEQEATISSKKELLSSYEQNMSLLEHKNKELKAKVIKLQTKVKELEAKVIKLQQELKIRAKNKQEQLNRAEKRKELATAKRALKADKSELSTLISTERSEINIYEVEQFIEASTGRDRRIARKYLICREDFDKFSKYKDQPDILEAEDIKLEELENELIEAEKELLNETDFKPSKKNEPLASYKPNDFRQQNDNDNDVENDSFLGLNI